MIKAIDTKHNGYLFRSRLEARWAVFFDTLGVEYWYEHEGYDLGDGIWYLPDFYLPKLDIFYEIKPFKPTEAEEEKAYRLSLATVKTVCIAWGNIQWLEACTDNEHADIYIYTRHRVADLSAEEQEEYRDMQEVGGWDMNYHWCECPKCGNIGLEWLGRVERITHKSGCSIADSHKEYSYDTARIRRAYDAARMARF